MDKKIAGLLGAVAGLAILGSAHAAPDPAATSEVLQASSYANLLAPVGNASAPLQAHDTVGAQRTAEDFQLADYYDYAPYPHYYHHHHHGYWSRYWRIHHHHHHHTAYIGVPGTGGVVVNEH